MLNENIKSLRKARGMSQEELAARLNVVRQTISKWEKGLSVPDAGTLVRMAETLEVSVSELLGAPAAETGSQNEVAEQLGRINEQLAVKNRRSRLIWRVVAGILIAFVCFNIVAILLNISAFVTYSTVESGVEEVMPEA